MSIETRLDEFDKLEWQAVARQFLPDLTDAEYDRMWAEFQVAKLLHALS